jgi:hypothetical protein
MFFRGLGSYASLGPFFSFWINREIKPIEIGVNAAICSPRLLHSNLSSASAWRGLEDFAPKTANRPWPCFELVAKPPQMCHS